MSLKDGVMKDEFRKAYGKIDLSFSEVIQTYLDTIRNQNIDGETAILIFNILEEGIDLMNIIDPERYDRKKHTKIIKKMF